MTVKHFIYTLIVCDIGDTPTVLYLQAPLEDNVLCSNNQIVLTVLLLVYTLVYSSC